MVVGTITTTGNGDIEVRCVLCGARPQADSAIVEDDDFDRRPQRRRYEEPAHIRVRKQLLSIAESVLFPTCWLLHG